MVGRGTECREQTDKQADRWVTLSHCYITQLKNCRRETELKDREKNKEEDLLWKNT